MSALVRRVGAALSLALIACSSFAADDAKPAAKKDDKSAAQAVAPVIAARPAPRSLDEALRRMESVRVNVSFKDEKFDDVVGYVARAAGFNVIVAPVLQPETAGIAPLTLTLKNVTLKQVVDFVTKFTKTALKIEGGILQFTTPKDARGKPVLHIYAIGELTMKIRHFPGPDLNLRPSNSEFEQEEESETAGAFSDPDKIVEMIQKTCSEETWAEDGVSISADESKLIVKTYPEVHREIARLIAMLRGAQ